MDCAGSRSSSASLSLATTCDYGNRAGGLAPPGNGARRRRRSSSNASTPKVTRLRADTEPTLATAAETVRRPSLLANVMGCFGGSSSKNDAEEDKKRKEANKRIEKQIQKDKQIYRATHRLLLLGKLDETNVHFDLVLTHLL